LVVVGELHKWVELGQECHKLAMALKAVVAKLLVQAKMAMSERDQMD